MEALTRRTLVRALPSLAAAVSLPAGALASQGDTPIAELFQQWKATNDDAFPDDPLPGTQSAYERYRELQEAIADETPLTVADVARQFIVETDDGASEYRDEFWEKMKRLAGEA